MVHLVWGGGNFLVIFPTKFWCLVLTLFFKVQNNWSSTLFWNLLLVLQKNCSLDWTAVDWILCSSFRQEALITFYASLRVFWCCELHEQGFLCMQQNISEFYLSISNVYSHDVMQIGISEVEPSVNSLAEHRQAWRFVYWRFCFFCTYYRGIYVHTWYCSSQRQIKHIVIII